MKKCKLKQAVRIPSGHDLILTESQLASRINKVVQGDGDTVFSIAILEFKAGETVVLNDSDVKILEKAGKVVNLEAETEAEAEAEAETESEAEAEAEAPPRKRPRGRPRKTRK